ncbi:EAP30/Vps36 family-domain-containing protein [Syncephalis fuscata]|nr:EAP30/Vps36 family-domain-containing protein [Syncephalis fuscata]
MRRRGLGLAGLQKQQQVKEQFRELGQDVQEQQVEQLRLQLERFRTLLEQFACEHRDAIRKDPVFRARFQAMCTRLGVDPLASNKGFWANLLGQGDFYYELAVQMIEASIVHREADGGLVAIDELHRRVVRRRRGNGANITEDDVIRAMQSLKVLGGGLDLITIGDRRMVRTVPRELGADETAVLACAQSHAAHITISQLQEELDWTLHRAETCLTDMLANGLCWIDEQTSPFAYWFPSLMTDLLV